MKRVTLDSNVYLSGFVFGALREWPKEHAWKAIPATVLQQWSRALAGDT